ncbi:MAG: hypothetical protein KIT60_30035 [Burkholderiaceae bacterium]|nr:hypothetical protein [Burkholderiaceae bacterium]
MKASDNRSRWFDKSIGVDTGGILEIGALSIRSRNAMHGNRYQATAVHVVEDFLDLLPPAVEEFCFIDFGAGKGRVLMVAARRPFLKVVGVEFAQELHAVAIDNIAHEDRARRAKAVECVHIDAVDFEPPPMPLVCYFYNPFGPTVMGVVIDRLMRSLRAQPRDAYVIYADPAHIGLFRRDPRWREIASHRAGVVLRFVPDQ